MKAAVCYEGGAPDVLRYEEVADPVPGDREVLIRVEAISIEGGDPLHRRAGGFARTPHIVGYQAAGTVVATGAAVTAYREGDRVVTVGLDGSHAELRAADVSACWPIPAGLDTEVAACIPIAYGTAHDCLFEFGRLPTDRPDRTDRTDRTDQTDHPGHTDRADQTTQANQTDQTAQINRPSPVVLVQAAAGGVGLAAVQMAKQAGATVIATASSDERLARIATFGADQGINYTTTDFVTAVRDLTAGRGADVIVESVGGDVLQRSLDALAYRGRCVSVGDAGRGAPMKIDVSGLRPSNQSLIGYFLGAELFAGDRAYKLIARLIDQVARGELKVEIDSRYPLAEAAAAHAHIESRRAFGRVVLIP